MLDQDGTAYIPLKAAMTALGGKAEDDGKGAWNVTCGESTATVDADDGRTKVTASAPPAMASHLHGSG